MESFSARALQKLRWGAAGLVALMGSTLATGGCACPGVLESGLVIWVIGGAEGAAMGMGGAQGAPPQEFQKQCEDRITLSPADEITCVVKGEDCRCSSYFGHSGKVEVTAELNGRTETKRVKIKKGRCGPKTETVCFFGACPE